MRILAVLCAIFIQLAGGPARAQDPKDLLGLQGDKVALTLSPDRLGVLVKDGTEAGRVNEIAGRRVYKIAETLRGVCSDQEVSSLCTEILPVCLLRRVR